MRARGLVALVVSLCLVAACAEEKHTPRTTPTAGRSSGSPSTGPPRTPPPTPPPTPSPSPRPSTTAAAGVAAELTQALATVRSRDSSATAVRAAAELHQLAVRRLALAPERFRRKVFAGLAPPTAAIVAREVRAQVVLSAISPVHRDFPPWRIVAPAPQGELLGYYRAAERALGVPWTYLAAINLVETRTGRIRGPSTAGAQGPMQFLPSTWAEYGAGGDINDPHDAIFAAARLLRSHGAPQDLAGALWHYNPSQSYVTAVTEFARTLEQAPWVYRSYWHWRVLYHLVRGTYVLPEGYPKVRPVLLERR